jgi:alanine dehydrogenase
MSAVLAPQRSSFREKNVPVFLSNTDQEICIDANEAIQALEHGLRQFARGDAIRRPRIDNVLPTPVAGEYFCFSSMEGGIRDPGYYALRIKPEVWGWREFAGKRRKVTYASEPGLYAGLVLLYSTKNAEFLAIMNDGFVQHLRVAATAALGIKYLSRPESKVMGIFGSGGMARLFPIAAKIVRPIERIQVFSLNRPRLEQYCEEMRPKIDCEIVAVSDPESVTRHADIVASCTNSQDPVVFGKYLEKGAHLTNCTHFELSDDAAARIDSAGLFVRRSPISVKGYIDDDFTTSPNIMAYIGGSSAERAAVPAGNYREDRYPNARYVDCCDWDSGAPYWEKRRKDEITILSNCSYGTLEGEVGASSGIQGIQFSSIAGRIYEHARERNIGANLPSEMFLQDIPT